MKTPSPSSTSRTLLLLLLSLILMGCTTIATMSTQDLKLEYAQHERMIATTAQLRREAYKEIDNRRRKMEHIEKELSKRYHAGDSDAYLPIFGK